ncbi:MAG: hypothetical protein V4753_06160 [Pseudomonadota bacterium]
MRTFAVEYQHRAAPDRRVGEQHPFWALHGATPPPVVLQAEAAKRPPEGAVGRCPAARGALIPGEE